MIVTEELLSREWKCFLHLARRKREENLSQALCPGWNAPAVESDSEKKTAPFFHLSLVVRISHWHSMETPS